MRVPDAGAPDPAEPPDARGASALGPLPDTLAVPDDISELDNEVRAYRREQRAAAARARRRRLARQIFGTLSRLTGGQRAPALPVLVAGLLLVALVSGTLVLLDPRQHVAPAPAPLATAAAPVGDVGGLLPPVDVSAGTSTISVRDLSRPGVFVLYRGGCQCAALLRDIVHQSSMHELRVHVLAAPGGAAEARAAIDSLPYPALVDFAVDVGDTLGAVYAPPVHRLTVLLLRADGVVTTVLRGVAPLDPRLPDQLDRLVVAAN
jgi:hypothetical protein